MCALSGCEDVSRKSVEAPRKVDGLEGLCQVHPPTPPAFEPEVEWAWTGSPVMPTHTNVMMTPVVVDTNGDGTPDVVFNSYEGNDYTLNGVLRAIDGATGHDLWTVTDPAFRVRGASQIAAGDIDGDGRVELCTVPENGVGLLCFEHDGTFKFRTEVPGNTWGGPSLADLDGDGTVEIINGSSVFSHTGVRKWVGSDGAGGAMAGPISFAADIDQDGALEVINDRAIYRADGTLKCRNTALGHGFAGVGNFDADPQGEVVVVASGKVSLMDDNCQLIWSTELPGGGLGGAPNIADFDQDGQPEVGVAGNTFYTVFETDGSVKWSSPTHDASSGRTGSSTFDFEGDGPAEVVYADEDRLRVYDGATGAVRFEAPHSSCTAYENPVIADVDGDDNAELLVAQNTSCSKGSYAGIRVFRDRHDGWVNTRRLWNQHAYSITHVNDDGTIPAHPPAPWLAGFNSFRSNTQGTLLTSPFAAPDVRLVSVAPSTCAPGGSRQRLLARVRNAGEASVSPGLAVAFYAGTAARRGALVGVGHLPRVLAPGAEADVTLEPSSAWTGSQWIWAVADDDGTGLGREAECDEGNNTAAREVRFGCAPPPGWTRTGSLLAARRDAHRHGAHGRTGAGGGRLQRHRGGVRRGQGHLEPHGRRARGPPGPHRHAAARWPGAHRRRRAVHHHALHRGVYLPASGRWRSAGGLREPRFHHAASLLPRGPGAGDGRQPRGGRGGRLASAEVYDPATDTWTPTGAPGMPRLHPTAVLLPGGLVLVVGGVDAQGHFLASAEVYDADQGTFSPVADMSTGRGWPGAALLADGTVLVTGGGGLESALSASAERYQPLTRSWPPTGPMRQPRRAHTATLLPSGRVLVAGGYHESSGILTRSELFNPATGLWEETDVMNVDRYGHTATPLPDGTVLAVGGTSNRDPASAEFYTPR